MIAHGGQDQDGVAAAAALLSEVAGLLTVDHRADRTGGAIERAMRLAGVRGAAYRQLLEHDPGLLQNLIDQVTVDESHFFREAAHFDLLRGGILADLLRARPASHRLQVWSAGCASGEEAYTIAMVLEELGLADRADVLGTDISSTALRQARAATYRPWSLRGVDEDRRRAYFRAEGDRFVLDRRFVQRVTLRQVNLVADPYPAPCEGAGFDAILCRNVLIYLTGEAIEHVVGRLTSALAPGGWLVTASTDPHLASVPGLEAVVTDGVRAYRRTTTPSPRPQARAGRRRQPVARSVATRSVATRPATTRPAETPPVEQPGAAVADAEAEYARATALLDDGQWAAAARAARNVLYLQPDLVVAQVALGHASRNLGDLAGAARAWRNAHAELAQLEPESTVALSGGASAGRLLAEVSVLIERWSAVPR